MRARLGVLGVLAVTLAGCGQPVRIVTPTADGPAPRLWQAPENLGAKDLFNGPWGAERAPDPAAAYTFIETKHTGVNPGMTVRDARGQEWSVKLPPTEISDTAEAPIEVVVSRVLSGLGYFQPPVYYLPSFKLTNDWGTAVHRGGRFRLKDKSLKDIGNWSLVDNPFVGTPQYTGLLVILMMLNGSDLKDSNNTVYQHRTAAGPELWFVVRDLGTALGGTGRLSPRRGDLAVFERSRFIRDVRGGFVVFDYNGWHQQLVDNRLTPADVGWGCELAGRLSDQQWHDAFRAGGYDAAVAARYIRAIRSRIALGREVAATGRVSTGNRR